EKDAKEKVKQAWRYSPSIATMLIQIVSHPPVIKGTASTYTLTWGEGAITARVSRLKEHSNGDISGFLAFTTTLPGMPPKIHQAKFNFATTQSRVSLAKVLHQRAPALDQNRWLGIVETLCDTLIERLQEGEPPVVLGIEDVDPEPTPYILSPVVPAYEPTIVFGLPYSLKSYFVQYLMCLITVGQSDESLGFFSEMGPMNCLYLDWEDSEDRLRQRFSLLQRGQGLPKKEIYYQRCSRSLADDVDRLQGLIIKYNIGFLVVDSLGPACGGDLNSAQPAIAFFNALRSLRISSVITAHRAKNGDGKTSPYGSIFFSALGRSVWEMISHQEEGSSEADVGLFHRSSNLSRLEPPKGFRFVFDDNNGTTTIRPQAVGSIPGVRESVTLSGKIHRLLSEVGAMTVREIAEDLGKPTESVRTTVKRMRDSKKVTQLADKKWGILVKDEAPF
ncbi:MAG: AAA family ATPase, partial [Methanotrichaceae archaeon]